MKFIIDVASKKCVASAKGSILSKKVALHFLSTSFAVATTALAKIAAEYSINEDASHSSTRNGTLKFLLLLFDNNAIKMKKMPFC